MAWQVHIYTSNTESSVGKKKSWNRRGIIQLDFLECDQPLDAYLYLESGCNVCKYVWLKSALRSLLKKNVCLPITQDRTYQTKTTKSSSVFISSCKAHFPGFRSFLESCKQSKLVELLRKQVIADNTSKMFLNFSEDFWKIVHLHRPNNFAVMYHFKSKSLFYFYFYFFLDSEFLQCDL